MPSTLTNLLSSIRERNVNRIIELIEADEQLSLFLVPLRSRHLSIEDKIRIVRPILAVDEKEGEVQFYYLRRILRSEIYIKDEKDKIIVFCRKTAFSVVNRIAKYFAFHKGNYRLIEEILKFSNYENLTMPEMYPQVDMALLASNLGFVDKTQKTTLLIAYPWMSGLKIEKIKPFK